MVKKWCSIIIAFVMGISVSVCYSEEQKKVKINKLVQPKTAVSIDTKIGERKQKKTTTGIETKIGKPIQPTTTTKIKAKISKPERSKVTTKIKVKMDELVQMIKTKVGKVIQPKTATNIETKVGPVQIKELEKQDKDIQISDFSIEKIRGMRKSKDPHIGNVHIEEPRPLPANERGKGIDENKQ